MCVHTCIKCVSQIPTPFIRIADENYIIVCKIKIILSHIVLFLLKKETEKT